MITVAPYKVIALSTILTALVVALNIKAISLPLLFADAFKSEKEWQLKW